MNKKIPSEQLTPKQRETLLKLEESGTQAEIAKVLERHGLPKMRELQVIVDDPWPSNPPPGICYCTDDAGISWYCCVRK